MNGTNLSYFPKAPTGAPKTTGFGTLSQFWDTGPFEALARWNYTSQWYYGDPTGGGGTAGGPDRSSRRDPSPSRC